MRGLAVLPSLRRQQAAPIAERTVAGRAPPPLRRVFDAADRAEGRRDGPATLQGNRPLRSRKASDNASQTVRGIATKTTRMRHGPVTSRHSG